MEKDLERYYNDFKRPPFAPTFHPTEEEFADPISYVAKIKPQAQQFGLIKIIPPPSFRPPFCIEPAKFEFVPRVQRLNEIDALFRLRIIYINKLVHFWKYSKDQQFRIPYIDNKYIDLYRLRQMVDEEGGLKRVNDARRWAHIAKCLGFRGNAGQTMRQCYTRWIHPFELSVTNKEQHHEQQQQRRTASTSPKKGAAAAGGGGKIRSRRSKQKVAATTAQPQHTDAATMDQPQQQLHDEEGSCSSASCSVPSSSSSCSQLSSSSISAGTGTAAKCIDEIGAVQTAATAASVEAVQVQGSAEGTEMALSTAEQQLNTDEQHNNRDTETEEDEGHHKGEADEEEEEVPAPPLTRSQARMMAGSAKTAVPSLDKSSIQAGHRTTPIELVMCGRCGAGDDEARLLLCETCDASMHTYCATPPLAVVPKGEWRCAQCVASAVRSVSMDFGFTDSNQCFTLDTFGEWANLYKQQYFNQEPHEVPPDRVEREFWRNVIDIDKGVQVKYGADLISSKVGSGFPRREDPAMRGGVAADARERQQYANHPWNLHNLPKVRESVLCHMTTDISGMIIPWVYIGMLFSTFCWHVEDHWSVLGKIISYAELKQFKMLQKF
ncbi:hypothetical protein niasHS_001681 [Heterodera schachtii]|uniref:[Histone H3]-trimethyl-L-lysine(4) demethylase n=1 Tax=Heterodera schachtii TaxID=97005 RepID=A0ABD2KC03_HETSC